MFIVTVKHIKNLTGLLLQSTGELSLHKVHKIGLVVDEKQWLINSCLALLGIAHSLLQTLCVDVELKVFVILYLKHLFYELVCFLFC